MIESVIRFSRAEKRVVDDQEAKKSSEVSILPNYHLSFNSVKMAGQQPVFVMNTGPERQHGRKAQISNITAAKVSTANLFYSLSLLSFFLSSFLPLSYSFFSKTDSSRCNQDMSWSKGNAQNDPRSNGWNPFDK